MLTKISKRCQFTYFIPLIYLLLYYFRKIGTQTPFISKYYEQANLVEYLKIAPIDIIKNPNFGIVEYFLAKTGISGIQIMIISILFLIVNLVLLNIVLKKLDVKPTKRFFTLIFLAITPIFISSSFFVSAPIVSINLFFISILLKNEYLKVLIEICSLVIWLPVIIVLLPYEYTKKEGVKTLRKILILSIIFLFTYFLSIFPKLLFSSNLDILKLSNFASEFGNLYGYSFIILLLSLIGFILSWFTSKKNFMIHLFFIILFFASLRFPSLTYISIYFISFWASETISFFNKREWELKTLKNMALFIIFCLVLFSTLFYSINLLESKPTFAQANSLMWMNENNYQGIILSSYKNSDMINYFSKNNPFFDKKDRLSLDEANKQAEIIFYSRNILNTTNILDNQKIEYFYIDKDMKNGGIWTNKNHGLLFLLSNSELFEKIYDVEGIEIWRYVHNIS